MAGPKPGKRYDNKESVLAWTRKLCPLGLAPFIFRDRGIGESKLTFKTNLEYMIQLIDLYLYKIIE